MTGGNRIIIFIMINGASVNCMKMALGAQLLSSECVYITIIAWVDTIVDYVILPALHGHFVLTSWMHFLTKWKWIKCVMPQLFLSLATGTLGDSPNMWPLIVLVPVTVAGSLLFLILCKMYRRYQNHR